MKWMKALLLTAALIMAGLSIGCNATHILRSNNPQKVLPIITANDTLDQETDQSTGTNLYTYIR